MMTRYALLYECLDYECLNTMTMEHETVVAHYDEKFTGAVHHFEYIEAPINEAQERMAAQGWKYCNTSGPQSILMQHE
jgi:hypothetical protein